MIPKGTRDGRPVRQGKGVMPGGPDTFAAYGLPWANASNTPFRLFKHYVHEGGGRRGSDGGARSSISPAI
jgi:hypothetical protein